VTGLLQHCLIFHLTVFVIYLFSILCGLATDSALVHRFITESFVVATERLQFEDEQVSILLTSHESYLRNVVVFISDTDTPHKVTENSMDVTRSVDELLDVIRSQHCCYISISTCCEHLHLTTQ
jgi:hypothetical protein